MPRESEIVERMLERLTAIGAKAIKTHGSIYARRGTPDIVGCYRGRSFVIEVKQPLGKPTPIQLFELSQWLNAGAIAFVSCVPGDAVRTVETYSQLPWDDVKRLLDDELSMWFTWGGEGTDPRG
jgi:hypothetical protein